MAKQKIKVCPSILAADFGHIADEAKRVEQAGADEIHVDIMDGHFVRNLTMGPKMVAALNRATNLFLDVHLMIYNPYEYVERFVEAGADRITFHLEATEDVQELIDYIRKCNVEVGLAFCPETSEGMIPKYLASCDLMLLMTVHPGFGGQTFMPEVLDKIQFTRDLCKQLNIDLDIQVDGGINDKTALDCFKAGANVFVSGTYLFEAKNMAKAIEELKGMKA